MKGGESYSCRHLKRKDRGSRSRSQIFDWFYAILSNIPWAYSWQSCFSLQGKTHKRHSWRFKEDACRDAGSLMVGNQRKGLCSMIPGIASIRIWKTVGRPRSCDHEDHGSFNNGNVSQIRYRWLNRYPECCVRCRVFEKMLTKPLTQTPSVAQEDLTGRAVNPLFFLIINRR